MLQVKQTLPQFVRGRVGKVECGLDRGSNPRHGLVEQAWAPCNGKFGLGARLRLLSGLLGFWHGSNTTRSAPVFRYAFVNDRSQAVASSMLVKTRTFKPRLRATSSPKRRGSTNVSEATMAIGTPTLWRAASTPVS